MQSDRILRGRDAAAKLGISPRQFYREIEKGNIPAGIRMSEKTVGWRESVIDQVIADRERGQMKTKEGK